MNTRVLIVEDDLSLREALLETLNLAGFDTESATDGYNALNIINQKSFDIIISDVAMNGMDGHRLLRELKSSHPEIPVLLMTAYADISSAVQAIRDGAIDYLVKPFEAKNLINTINHFTGKGSTSFSGFVAESQVSKQLFSQAKKVAKTDATVLIAGESGTGKEVLARYIHEESQRSTRPFIAINCAAIPENMLEATLFGYEKGAFTGAYQSNAGKFEQAQYGTILLDEITEMDLALQAKLLRVLQEREIERLGGKKTIKLDVRVIATSNRNLKQAVEDGQFREDLYYRINVFPIKTIPLRHRVEDIVPLANFMLLAHCQKMKLNIAGITERASYELRKYKWPGNVRELDNVVQRALILRSGNDIDFDDIQFETEPHLSVAQVTPNDNLKLREYAMVIEELKAQKGCRKKTAEKLGISPRTLRYKLAKIRESGIEVPETKTSETD